MGYYELIFTLMSFKNTNMTGTLTYSMLTVKVLEKDHVIQKLFTQIATATTRSLVGLLV